MQVRPVEMLGSQQNAGPGQSSWQTLLLPWGFGDAHFNWGHLTVYTGSSCYYYYYRTGKCFGRKIINYFGRRKSREIIFLRPRYVKTNYNGEFIR
jgi:hypothetical protein